MKMISRTMFLTFFLSLSLIACNNEELFIENPVSDVIDDDTTAAPEDADNESVPIDAATPCQFDLTTAKPNQTVIINCVLDLAGATINVPANVTIVYEGGDIINGTLNFTKDAVLSGELMNSSLAMTGSKPQLKDESFTFNPKRWGIVEGIVSSAVALKNRDILEKTMLDVKKLGINTFRIDKMDAYFEVAKMTSTSNNKNYYPSIEAINIPSDFTLIMSNNTHLRVQPNDMNDYVLLGIRNESNVTIEGGNLYGDRDKHSDSKTRGNSGHVIQIHGSKNVDINGVRTVNGTGDGININSLGFTFESDYIPSNNIVIKNCVLDNNRRNNISITDGFDILVDRNTFLNAGVDNPNSPGVAPGFAIDVEAVRKRDSNGNFVYYEKAYNITISNNTERGSKYGAFIVAIGEDVVIENNTTQKAISIGDGAGVKILNNKITAKQINSAGAGIATGHPDSTTASNNVIAGNTISGYTVGIAVYTRDNEIYDNKIIDFVTGIQPKNVKNINIYRNTFESSLDNSVGIFGNITSMNNVNIYENKFLKTGRESIKMVMVNANSNEANSKVTIRKNELGTSTVTISKSKNIDFKENKSGNISLINSEFINLSGNSVTSKTNHGIELSNGCNNITIAQNNIIISNKNKECIYQNNSSNVKITSNSCN